MSPSQQEKQSKKQVDSSDHRLDLQLGFSRHRHEPVCVVEILVHTEGLYPLQAILVMFLPSFSQDTMQIADKPETQVKRHLQKKKQSQQVFEMVFCKVFVMV